MALRTRPSPAAPPAASSTETAPGPRRWLVLAVASTAQFLAILDLFAVSVAFPALRDSFPGASLPQVSWVLNAYTIVLAALLVPAGRLADDTSRKRAFLVGMALFGAASVGCALAPALPVLVAARIAQAAAGAVLIPTSLGLALPAFPAREHPTVMGVWTAVAAFGAGFGPVAGGLLLTAGWRWIFLINVPVTALAVLAGRRLLPDARRASRQRLDLLGALLILGTTGMLTTAIVQGPAWGYGSPGTLGCAAAAVVLGALAALHMRRHPNPVIGFALFRHRPFRIAVSGVFLYYLAFAAMLLSTTLFLTVHWHYSPVRAALAVSPEPVACMLLSPLSGWLVGRIGARAAAALGGLTLAAAAGWWALAITPEPSYLTTVMPGLALVGASTALLQPPLFGSAATLPGDRISLGSAVLMMSRQISSALGVAVLTAILGNSAAPSPGAFQAGWTAMTAAGVLAALVSLRYRIGPSGARPRKAPARPS
ncbi:MFS transporter [Actinomadura macrotermitis]|uniref:Multidrug resistance protein Stp n=1 Tax=Actinomadura macrotermitis TaxID=2585200 RepID=A0A7K0BWG3_9ACTN|nr:MFS transporter [Actinomadura macrotermitis]MQY05520.1 Multidrug resistance protein Stp [Actinomadura macrotermitis]